MKTPVFHFVFLALFGSFFVPPAVAHMPTSPADSAHFQPFDYEQWERERALRPAAKRLQDLNVGDPRTVRLFYFLPNDRSFDSDVVDAMKTGIVELQTFFADQMEEHGHGRKTFQFETDEQGEPIVHRVDGDYDDSHYSSRGHTEGEIERAFDNSANVALIVMDISRSRIAGQGTGTKSGGWLIMYRGWNWPTVAHELGHAFGLHHDFRDRAYILSYGQPDRSSAKLSACAAEFLAVHPYFNSDIPLENESPPTVELVSSEYPPESESTPVRLRVRDDDGLHQVILLVRPRNPFLGGTPEVKACHGLSGETDTVVEFNFDGRLPSDNVGTDPEAHTTLSNSAQHQIHVVAVDRNGNTTPISTPISFTLEAGHSPQHIATLDRYRSIRSTAFSPDGTILALATYRRVELLEASTREHIAFLGHGFTEVYSVAFSPDGTLLASSSGDGIIKLWNVSTRENIATLAGHMTSVWALDFSPDGALLASGSSDLTIKLWNVVTKENSATLEGHTSRILSVAFLPNGTLASKSYGGTVKLWDVTTESPISTFETDARGGVFSPDGTILAVSANGWIEIWDILTREFIVTISGGPGAEGELLFSPEGAQLVSAWRKVKFWDVSEWSGPPLVSTTPPAGICDRTEEVRNAIVDLIDGVSDCALVTDAHLAEISGAMEVDTGTILKVSDFDGLTSVTGLELTTEQLPLPVGVFNGLTSLTQLDVDARQLTSLPAGIFDDLTSLTRLVFLANQSSTLPDGIFDRLANLTYLELNTGQLSTLPDGIFDQLTNLTTLKLGGTLLNSLPDQLLSGLSSLTTLHLGSQSVDPLALTVSLEKVGERQFKAVAPTGAPFDIVLPLNVSNGTIDGGATTITIPAGSLESQPLTVTRTPGTSAAVRVDIGTLPVLPQNHSGYTLVKSTDPPLEVISRDATDAATVTIPDANLRAQIESALGKASGDPISTAEMETLTTLSAQDASISDLTGLETATNLTELQLWDNTIADISALAGLTKLTKLYLWGNNIADISYVAGLTNLLELYLDDNMVSDLSPLVANTGLGENTEIDVQDNPLDCPSLYTHIPALQARSVFIEFDNRTPTTLVKVSGDSQQGTPSTALANPFVVEVQDAKSVAFAGVPVVFAVTAGGGTLSATNTNTDANGRAASTLTLSSSAGTNTVQVSVQGISQSATFTAEATTTNTAPVFTDGTSTTRTIAENTAAGVNIGTAIAATDADNDGLTYTLGGIDAAAFAIDSTTGQLQTSAALDYETKFSYSVVVTVSDGSLTDTITVTINVTDIAEQPAAIDRTTFESSTPSGYTQVTLSKTGSVWGVPTQYTSGSDVGTLAFMVLGTLKGCSFANAEAARQSKVYVKTQELGLLNSFGSAMACGTTISSVSSEGFKGARITRLRFFDESSPSNVKEGVYNTATDQIEIPGESIVQPLEQPEESVNVTLSTSTTSPLTEATLHESVVTLTLSGGTYARRWDIEDALTVVGIPGVAIASFGIDRVSDTQITVELEFNGNMDTDATLTFTVGADAIVGYNGPALAAQITVTAVTENTLAANFPNPFNPETWISYQLAESAEVAITIYAVNGQVVRRLTRSINVREPMLPIGMAEMNSDNPSRVVCIFTR